MSLGEKSLKLILIAGLPGSGKSMRVRELSTRLESESGSPVILRDWRGWNPEMGREDLYEMLQAGNSCIVESAGFCIPPHLADLREELSQRFPDLRVEIECFDNNPLQCIILSLKDTSKEYGGNGALARIGQILRDCTQYQPDSHAARILPVHPCKRLVSYRPGRNPEYDDLLERLGSILSEDGRPVDAKDFKAMAREKQDEMRAMAWEYILQSKLNSCSGRGIRKKRTE